MSQPTAPSLRASRFIADHLRRIDLPVSALARQSRLPVDWCVHLVTGAKEWTYGDAHVVIGALGISPDEFFHAVNHPVTAKEGAASK